MNNQVTVSQQPTVARRVDPFPRLWDWFESMVPMEAAWRETAARAIKVEEFARDNRYVVRAELPGVDPDKDIDVSIDDGMLTITGERREEVHEDQRTEFHYGRFVRSLPLPTGVDASRVEAEYKDGILEVSMPKPEPATEPTRIAITRPE